MILKFQQGGVAAPPLVSYQPVMSPAQETTGTADTTSKKTETTDLTDKDLLTMLEKLQGLPSDMTSLVNTLQNFYIDRQYSPFPNTSNIASRYLQTLFQMQTANFNKKEYDNAFDTVSKNGGINEIAINDRGQVFCMNNEGDFKLLTVDQLKSNSEYQPLTNSDLLNFRAYSPQLAYNNDILKVVKNGIGMETVTKMIQDNISNLGTSTESSEGYAKMKSQQLITGLQDFINAQEQSGNYDATVDNLYKSKLLTKNQAMQSQQALAYIYRTLPENAKTLLKTKTQNGTDSEAIELVSTLVNSKLNYSREFSLDLDKEASNSSADKTVKDKSQNMTLATMIQMDKGTPTKIPIVPGTSDIMISDATMYPVTKHNGDSVGVTSLDSVAKDSAITGLFDFSQVTFGDQMVEMGGLQNIVVDGSSLYKAYLPIDQEKAAKGIITPNLTQLAQLELARNKIKETGATTPEEINNIYTEYGLPPLYISEKEFTNYYRPFGIMNGAALSDAFSDPQSARVGSPMLEEITDENDINNYWNIIKGTNSKDKFSSKGILDSFTEFFGGDGTYQQMFKGLVFLPLKTNDLNYGNMVGGEKLTANQVMQNQIKYQQEQRIKTYKPQGQLQL